MILQNILVSLQKKIIPISLCNIQEIHSSNTMMFKPGQVIIRIHKPIDPKDYSLTDEGIKALNEKCYSIIYKVLIKYDNRKKRI